MLHLLGPERPLRSSAGRPRTSAAAVMANSLGPFWVWLAEIRTDWREATKAVVGSFLRTDEIYVVFGEVGSGGPGPPSALRPFKFVRHISNKQQDLIGLGTMTNPVDVQFICGNSVVVGMVNGKYKTTAKWDLYVECCQWYHYMLVHRWRCGWEDSRPLFAHQKREHNALADSLANYVLDMEINQVCWIDEGLHRLPLDTKFLVTSDGAFRKGSGADGCASVGVAIRAFLPSVSEVLTIAAWARRCDVQDSMQAEFEGAIDACRMFVKVMCEAGFVL